MAREADSMIRRHRGKLWALIMAAQAWGGINDYGAGVYGGGHYKDRQKWRNVPTKRKNRKRRTA